MRPPRPVANQPAAPLLGSWQFQYQEQRSWQATGEVVEVIRQEPPLAAYQMLTITEQTLISAYEYRNGSPAGQHGYTVTRQYTRHGTTLLVVPAPGVAPSPTLILELTTARLVLLQVPAPALGLCYEWETGFTR